MVARIGRRTYDEAHYAEYASIDKRLRLLMQGANPCPWYLSNKLRW